MFDIKNLAKKLFKEKVAKNRAIRLIGVGVSNITDAGEKQLFLFPTPKNEEKLNRVNDVLDKIREKFGRNSIRRGG